MLNERSCLEQTSPGILDPEILWVEVADDVKGFLYQHVSAHQIARPAPRTSATVVSTTRGAPYAIKIPRWIASVIPFKNIALYGRVKFS